MENTIILPDDTTRPLAPKIAAVTPQQRRHGQRLSLFHAMHLREMSRVNRAMEQVFAGNGSAEELLTTITSMQMVSNMRQFGNLCGATCEMLTGHHSIEDHYLFPRLKGFSDGLNKVVERLQAEHLVIHDLLVNLESAAIALINAPASANAKSLRAAFAQLEGFVKSHFGYEQTELEEALGFYNIEI
jgi:Hemerythrin HHE cation binding domain